MSINIPKPVIILMAYIVTSWLYWPALDGTPIWDDLYYWFYDINFALNVPYQDIWQKFTWPLSVSLQKFLLQLWGYQYTNYHWLNLALHFLNSFMVYQLGLKLKLRFSIYLFLLFLLHPTCVIAVGWMIQFKTLLCMSLALGAILLFLKSLDNKGWLIPSWIFFFLSVASKSASISLPLALIFMVGKKLKGFQWLYLIPFFLISGWNAHRILSSSFTQAGIQKASSIVEKQEQEARPTNEELSFLQKSPESLLPHLEILPLNIMERLDLDLVARTLHYYFWQTILPINNQPVKGLNLNKAGPLELMHIIFLVLIICAFWRQSVLLYFLMGHILLLPFLGLVPAPYMSITWVSDQHLYIALPAFLCFWLKLLERVQNQTLFLIPLVFVIYFGSKTFRTTPYYENQFVFYEQSLRYNPANVPLTYNLAFAYMINGRINEALTLLSTLYEIAQKEPSIKTNFYWKETAEMHDQLLKIIEKR